MRLKFFATVLSLFAVAITAQSQVTTYPSPLQLYTQGITIYYHADEGNQALKDLPASTAIYAHTGLITSQSANNGDWKYATSWGGTSDTQKYRLQWVSDNLWSLYIGNIQEFYGVPANVDVKQLAFVFKTAGSNPSAEGKTANGGDIYVNVVDEGLQLEMLTPGLRSSVVTELNTSVTIEVNATEAADINLTVTNNGTTTYLTSQQGATQLIYPYTFSEPGNYTFIAEATAGDQTSTATQTVVVAVSSPEDYPGIATGQAPPMGPIANADGSVTFCLAAPGKDNVILVGAWNNYEVVSQQAMNYTDVVLPMADGTGNMEARYFWTTVDNLDADSQYGYYFIVDGQYTVGDPYARLVLDPWNDKYITTDVYPDLPEYPYDKIDGVPLAIYQGNINDYTWQVDNFKGVNASDLIIYELLFRDFTGTEGKALGNGTVQQAIDKIPYLKTLGVNAIELLPIMEFNGNISWGYNPNFYFAPDKAYGTPDDYKEFIDICHQNGIAVILDMVFNQSDGLHPWYVMYPVGSNPFYNLNAPHAYSVLNDWNQGNPLVQQQWHDVLEYWMKEYRFDGFRFDLVKGLGNNESYPNNGDSGTNQYNQSRVDRMIELQKVVESINPNAYFINENLAGAQEENAMAAEGQLNWANVNTEGQQYAMGYQSNSGLTRMYAPNDSQRLWGSTVSYLESHDEERLAYKQNVYGANGVKGNNEVSMNRIGSAAAQMILTPGAHMIWQFSEIGNAQSTKASNGSNNTDPKTVNWSLLDKPANQGLYDSYCELIGIRNGNPDLFDESASFTMTAGATNWSGGRWLYSVSADKSKELYTLINPNVSGAPLTIVNVPFLSENSEDYYIISQSYNSNPTFDASAKTVTVQPNCYVTIASKKVSAIEDVSSDTSGLKAWGDVGRIVIEAAPGQTSVYSVDGRRLATIDEAGGTSVSVNVGVYIVVSGNESCKVLVR